MLTTEHTTGPGCIRRLRKSLSRLRNVLAANVRGMRILSRALCVAALSLPANACDRSSQRADAESEDDGRADAASDAARGSGPLQVLVFTRTEGFRHDSIRSGLALFEELERRAVIALRAT